MFLCIFYSIFDAVFNAVFDAEFARHAIQKFLGLHPYLLRLVSFWMTKPAPTVTKFRKSIAVRAGLFSIRTVWPTLWRCGSESVSIFVANEFMNNCPSIEVHFATSATVKSLVKSPVQASSAQLPYTHALDTNVGKTKNINYTKRKKSCKSMNLILDFIVWG